MPARIADLSKQHLAILGVLRSRPHTTLEIHRACGVLSVSARVHELRAMGHPIETHLITVRNRHGERCHVAQYVLRKPARRSERARAKRRA